MHIFPFVAFSVLFFVFYCLNYCVFSVALQDDVEFCKGKKRVKSRKKQKGFWKKFLFLDIRKEVILWHYLLFWVNLGAFVTACAAMLAFFIHINTSIQNKVVNIKNRIGRRTRRKEKILIKGNIDANRTIRNNRRIKRS